ncbi:recombinase family protein [Candidatus Accumulibacter phosphatis]|uniref:Recombinase family protein n=1 Tax=Candidatus Accumulibacter contiguus TaxID=2954381 RepID=A0ABX1TAX5_9PROT|nr:recombinase family protein [Candidatus Accumulibacter contiguus]NMQ06239.1 recombinase family protein [Candidatus Accumulibacter contiguus]
MSEKLKAQHFSRKAILYIRQSSAYQVSHNQESQKLQYAMRERLMQLGWREIEVIDEDLGRSAAGLVTRSGFERMVAEVCLGKVGAVAAREVSRFARNSREWQQLVEVCRVVDTVLIDQEMVYAPRQGNDRLLLGLKGSLNEYELDLLRQRSVEARREKARRGELLIASPVGYRKGERRLEKDPDRRVQEAVRLVFQKLGELGSVRQTLLWFLEHGLELPVINAREEVHWKRPSYGMLYSMLTNPAYAGAYAYGKTEQLTQYDGGEARQRVRRKPREQWLSFIPGAHDGYVVWEEFERLQATISENRMRREQIGAAQRGPALLAGLLRCRRCGHKLVVHYTGRCHDVLRYHCRRGWLDNGEPRCIGFAGLVVDQAITREVLRIVEPVAIEAAVIAHEEQARRVDEVLSALQRDLEAAQYSARRAQKQYDAADPENRLVTDELERRWNQSLQRVHEIESQIRQHRDRQGLATLPTREEFADLAADLESLWHDPGTDERLKKRVIRTLIREVVVDVDAQASEVVLVIHWRGGVHTELRLPRRRRGQSSTQTPTEVLEAVRVLAHICPDRLIAGVLNRNRLLTGRGNRWTQERITALRSYHHIPCYRADQRDGGPWMNLTEAAEHMGVSARTLRLAVARGEIEAQHPLADGPWVFNRDTLRTAAAAALVERVRSRTRQSAVPNTEQITFDFSST